MTLRQTQRHPGRRRGTAGRYFLRNVEAMQGYVPGEQINDADVIKLNSNENPYPPSPRVLAALTAAADLTLRRYPEPASDTLRAAAARVYGVAVEQIIAGNGSDELLSMLMRCFVAPGDRVAYATPTYSLYDTLVDIQGGTKAVVRYADDFAIPSGLARQRAAVTFLCNPNAPSGTLVSRAAIARLARAVRGILVVDEAYIDFADREEASCIPLVRRHPNVIVLRTFSKSFSLAGLRIGLAFASKEIVAGMMKVKDSYNLNRLSAVGATAALHDLAWMRRNVGRIQRSRASLSAALARLGFQVYPSQTNFVLARRPNTDMRRVQRELKAQRILIRHFDVPGLEDCLRISVGTPVETRTVMAALAAVIPAAHRPSRTMAG
jgi:histidinol-phosphate aminotransferase